MTPVAANPRASPVDHRSYAAAMRDHLLSMEVREARDVARALLAQLQSSRRDVLDAALAATPMLHYVVRASTAAAAVATATGSTLPPAAPPAALSIEAQFAAAAEAAPVPTMAALLEVPAVASWLVAAAWHATGVTHTLASFLMTNLPQVTAAAAAAATTALAAAHASSSVSVAAAAAAAVAAATASSSAVAASVRPAAGVRPAAVRAVAVGGAPQR